MMKLKKINLSKIAIPGLIVFFGIIVGLLIIKVAQSDLRVALAMILALCFAALWPVYARITGDPFKVMWILLFFSVPLEIYVEFVYFDYPSPVRGLTLGLTDLALIALIIVWFYQVTEKQTSGIQFNKLTIIAACSFLGAHIASLVNSPEYTISFYRLLQQVRVTLLFFFIAGQVITKKQFELVWRLLLLCLLFESSICILQYITKANFNIYFQVAENVGDDYFRVLGTTESPNVTATYLGSLLPVAIVPIFFKNSTKSVILPILTAAAGLTSLILTQTRGAWLSFAIGMFLFALLNLRRKGFIKLVIIASVLGIIMLAILSPIILERFEKGTETLEYREHLIFSAVQMVKAHPVFGVGANIYGYVMRDYVPFFMTQERYIVHNRYLLIISELGAVGFACLMFLMGSILWNFKRAFRTHDPFMDMFAWALFIGFCIFACQMMFESLSDRISDSHFWIMAGLSVAAASYVKKENENSNEFKGAAL